MAGTQDGHNSSAATPAATGSAAAGSGDPARPPAQVLMDLMDKLTTLLTVVVEPADKAQHDAEVARVREEMVQAKENLATEETRMAAERAALDARAQQLQAETFRLSVDLNASNEVMRRRHQKTQSRLPLTLDPRNLFHTPGAGGAARRRQTGSQHPMH